MAPKLLGIGDSYFLLTVAETGGKDKDTTVGASNQLTSNKRKRKYYGLEDDMSHLYRPAAAKRQRIPRRK